jgi:hypothetical protein
MSAISLSRRGFLYIVGTAGAAAIVGLGLLLNRARNRASVATFVALIDDLDAARVLGTAWAAQNRHEIRAVDVLEELRHDLGLQSRSVTPRQLRHLVARRIRTEYSEGRVGKIGNWVLSNTEIRLCALAAVTGPEVGEHPR